MEDANSTVVGIVRVKVVGLENRISEVWFPFVGKRESRIFRFLRVILNPRYLFCFPVSLILERVHSRSPPFDRPSFVPPTVVM
jgi:hypothetical protein